MEKAIIHFEGVNLITVRDEKTGEIYVALKPIAEALGLDWSSQRKKVKRLKEEKGVALKTIPLKTKGGTQEMLTINLYHLPAFLYSLQPSRVKPELKEKLIKFQTETTKIINDYWQKGYAVKEEPLPVAENPMPPIRLGKAIINERRAKILDSVSNFLEKVSKYNPTVAVREMNKILKLCGLPKAPLPIPPEDYLSQYNWLTVKEVADYFQISQNAVRNWIYRGKIFAKKIQGEWFIPREEFLFMVRLKQKTFKRPTHPPEHYLSHK